VANRDDAPTLKTLASRQIVVEKDAGIAGSEEKAIAAYRDFLNVAPRAQQRSEAMRRLGDLEMDSADNKSASAAASFCSLRATIRWPNGPTRPC